MEKKKKGSFKEAVRRAAEQVDIMDTSFFGLPHVEIDGDREVMIDCHKGLIEYSKECIRVAAANRQTIVVTGGDLRLVAMNKSQMRIKGQALSVQLVKQEDNSAS